MTSKTEKKDFEKMRSIFFYGLIIILGIILVYLFRPFLLPIFWAALIAIIFYPIYQSILKHIKIKELSIFSTMLIVVATIFLPLTILFLLLINESVRLYQSAVGGNLIDRVQSLALWLSNSHLDAYLDPVRQNWAEHVTKIVQNISVFLFNNLRAITQNSLKFIFQIFIMFYALYFFFKDGPRMLTRLMHLSPLGDDYEKMLYYRSTSTIRATLKGTVIVGGLQGIIMGILLYFTGVEGAIIWGVITALLAIIPGIGASIIWLPIGIITIILGGLWQGIVILAVGLAVISAIDNFLRPVLVGKDIQMHPLIIFFSTLGGVFIFGISGFVIGPIIAALFLSVITIYEHHYRSELTNN